MLLKVDDAGKRIHISDRDSAFMETPLKFYNSTSSMWVTCGTVAHDGLVLERPIMWPGESSQGTPDDGASCEAGSYFDDSALECKLCKPGWFSFTRGQSRCLPCQPGTYCGKEGCKARPRFRNPPYVCRDLA